MKFFKIIFLLSFVAPAYGMENQEQIVRIPLQFKSGRKPTDQKSRELTPQKQFKANGDGMGLIPHQPLLVVRTGGFFPHNPIGYSIYSTESGEKKIEINTLYNPAGSSSVRYYSAEPNGEFLGLPFDTKQALIFDIAAQQDKIKINAENLVYGVDFNAKMSELLLWNSENNLDRYDIRTGHYVATYEGPYELLSPDKTIGVIVRGAQDSKVHITLRIIENKKEVGSYEHKNLWNIAGVVLSPDNETFAIYDIASSIDPSKMVVIANCKTQKFEKFETEFQPQGVHFDPTGKYVIVPLIGIDKKTNRSPFCVYDSSNGKKVRQLNLPWVPLLGVSLDETRLAVGWLAQHTEKLQGTVQVWNNFDPEGEDGDIDADDGKEEG